ncbi:hypothetical protein, partial [Mesorhizobium japonicum]|uniref:hypothetical protein n=1 Tax=Mesorhizobium japonicum TaxID=2066070 RepID=UPI003B5C80EF
MVAGKPPEAEHQLSPRPMGLDTFIQDSTYATLPDRVTRYAILSTSTSGGTAVVTARMTTAAGSWNQRFYLHPRSHRLVLWQVWAIDGSQFSAIHVGDSAPPGTGLTLDDARSSSVADENGYIALPGTYHLTSTTGSPLVATQSVTVKVTSFQLSYDAGITGMLNDAGQAKARAAVAAFEDACVQQEVLAPTGGCGYYIIDDHQYTVKSVHWTIDKRPDVSFGAYRDGGWDVHTDATGTFVMDALITDGSRYGVSEAVVDDYTVRGYVEPDGNDGLRFISDYSDGDGASGDV